MNYAIIKTGGKQYKVTEGQTLEVDKLQDEKGKISFNEVLLLVSDKGVKIGKPTVAGEKIEAEILENVKGDKIRVSKYKSKVRYRRVIGFRAQYSKIKIGKVGDKTRTDSKLATKTTVKTSKKS